MNILQEFENESTLPSVIKDPFSLEFIGDVDIHRTQRWNGSEWYWYANVEFKNGLTQGKQRTPDCKTIDEVIHHIKQIFKSVQ